ncbi:MAG: VanZ family protein [Saprospiraceae bacterium]|nr:VanZ family protein [Saprospiraceae bacterium]MDW8483218.1 VanZ family protein [Saprospiraceae bacterium]
MIRAFAPALLWLAAVVFLSTMGGVSMPKFEVLSTDKLAHAAAYALLAWLTLWGFFRWIGRARALHGIFTVVTASLIGATLEYVQFRYFPDRMFEYDDMVANAVGAFIGWWAFAHVIPPERIITWWNSLE